MQCVQGNLEDGAQKSRMRLGLASLSGALLLEVILVRMQVPPIARTILFVPFFGAAFGAFQGLYRTCAFAAKEGTRITDGGDVETVADASERQLFRRRGRQVTLMSLLTALAATVASVLI